MLTERIFNRLFASETSSCEVVDGYNNEIMFCENNKNNSIHGKQIIRINLKAVVIPSIKLFPFSFSYAMLGKIATEIAKATTVGKFISEFTIPE